MMSMRARCNLVGRGFVWLIAAAGFLSLMPLASRAMSIIMPAPKFGVPVVTSNQVIFTYPDARKAQLISIHRETGREHWKTFVTNPDVQLWPTSRKLLVSIEHGIFELSTSTGRLEHRVNVGFPIERIIEVSPDLLLVKRDWRDGLSNVMLAVRVSDWTTAWTRTNVYQLLDTDRERVLVEFGEPDLRRSSYDAPIDLLPQKNMSIALLEAQDGRIVWRTPASTSFTPQTAVLADTYVLLSALGRFACLSARDGTLLNRVYACPADRQAAIWRDGVGVFTDFSSNLVATLDLPGLSNKIILRHEQSTVDWDWHDYRAFDGDMYLLRGSFSGSLGFDARTGKKVWPANESDRLSVNRPTDAHWAWTGVHNGMIYVSRAHLSTKETSIYAVDVRTGRERKLYTAPIPDGL
jgi:outer membrane protein assembly factor BamB